MVRITMDYISSKAQYVTSVILLEISEQLVRKVYESFLIKSTWFKQRKVVKKVPSVTRRDPRLARDVSRSMQ